MSLSEIHAQAGNKSVVEDGTLWRCKLPKFWWPFSQRVLESNFRNGLRRIRPFDGETSVPEELCCCERYMGLSFVPLDV